MGKPYMRKKLKTWNESDIEKAIAEIDKGKKSIRSISKELGVSDTMLRYRLKLRKDRRQMLGSGKKPYCLRKLRRNFAR